MNTGTLFAQIEVTHTRTHTHMYNLESYPGNITDSVTASTETSDEDFVLGSMSVGQRLGQLGYTKFRDKVRTFSSMQLRQPSRGTKAPIFLPFLMSCGIAFAQPRNCLCVTWYAYINDLGTAALPNGGVRLFCLNATTSGGKDARVYCVHMYFK